MDKGNGHNNSAHFWRETWDSDFIYSEISGEDDSSVEGSPFRGFEKQSKVLLKKFNVEPFMDDVISESNDIPLNGSSNSLPQLLSGCFVKLVRDDLDQLKKSVLKNSRQNKIRTSGILSMPFLHCKICEKAYGSEKKLQNHLENKHMLVYKTGLIRKPQKRVSFSDHVIVHELKEYHRCRKCTSIFEEYRSLKAHMKKQHRKRKCYICNYCSKNFVDRMFFKVHIKLHCDVCGLLMPNKRRYLMHRRDICRVAKKYTCKTCTNLFFSYMDLKDHSYDHLEDIFVCDVCKDHHRSKCAVSHHILYLHSKERPDELYTSRNLGNERLYLCNFCDASSMDRCVIDRHVSVLPDLSNRKRTGYMDYYFCDQCLRKFDTESSMLQHKWTHFLYMSNGSQVPYNRKVQRKSTPAKPSNEIRRTFKIHEKLPILMQPKIVLERLEYVKPQISKESILSSNFNVHSFDIKEYQRNENSSQAGSLQRVMVDPKSKGLDLNVKNGKNGNKVVFLSFKKGVDKLTSKEEVGRRTVKNTKFNLKSDEKVSLTSKESIIDRTQHEEVSVVVKNAIVDPKSKKTLLSRFQCEKCQKYYSSNYCLNRHMLNVHPDCANTQCKDCEENFVWPSLLESHNCIRMNIPEMPFDDARPEIQFDNYRDWGQDGIDEVMNISESDDFMNSVDFEIPAPIVPLTEYGGCVINSSGNHNSSYGMPVNSSYKIVLQEVPIEF